MVNQQRLDSFFKATTVVSTNASSVKKIEKKTGKKKPGMKKKNASN